jgi:hypothetical protein
MRERRRRAGEFTLLHPSKSDLDNDTINGRESLGI